MATPQYALSVSTVAFFCKCSNRIYFASSSFALSMAVLTSAEITPLCFSSNRLSFGLTTLRNSSSYVLSNCETENSEACRQWKGQKGAWTIYYVIHVTWANNTCATHMQLDWQRCMMLGLILPLPLNKRLMCSFLIRLWIQQLHVCMHVLQLDVRTTWHLTSTMQRRTLNSTSLYATALQYLPPWSGPTV